ncbi:MAG: protein DA1 [Magnetospirillum gryphiswaldense]|nr:protein DA1 [Magnetospirillum gryphiswaldense]
MKRNSGTKSTFSHWDKAADFLWRPERSVCACCRCGQEIVGRYSINLWGETTCMACRSTGDCFHCRSGGHLKEVDGRLVCSTCRELAVTNPSTAAKHVQAVTQWIDGLAALGRTPHVPLAFLSPKQMRDEFGVGERTLGLARKAITTWGSRKSVSAEGISIVRGLPWPIFEKVLAHELGHVWVAANGMCELAPQDEEGFCELLSYLWLTERGSLGKDMLLTGISESADPVYGAGFRNIHQRYALNGLPHIISQMRKGMPTDTGDTAAWSMKWPSRKI